MTLTVLPTSASAKLLVPGSRSEPAPYMIRGQRPPRRHQSRPTTGLVLGNGNHVNGYDHGAEAAKTQQPLFSSAQFMVKGPVNHSLKLRQPLSA